MNKLLSMFGDNKMLLLIAACSIFVILLVVFIIILSVNKKKNAAVEDGVDSSGDANPTTRPTTRRPITDRSPKTMNKQGRNTKAIQMGDEDTFSVPSDKRAVPERKRRVQEEVKEVQVEDDGFDTLAQALPTNEEAADIFSDFQANGSVAYQEVHGSVDDFDDFEEDPFAELHTKEVTEDEPKVASKAASNLESVLEHAQEFQEDSDIIIARAPGSDSRYQIMQDNRILLYPCFVYKKNMLVPWDEVTEIKVSAGDKVVVDCGLTVKVANDKMVAIFPDSALREKHGFEVAEIDQTGRITLILTATREAYLAKYSSIAYAIVIYK